MFNECSYGEEKGWRCKEESADYVWVLDPIDGTKSFITGILVYSLYFYSNYCVSFIVKFWLMLPNFPGKPVFGTLIALLKKGKPVSFRVYTLFSTLWFVLIVV